MSAALTTTSARSHRSTARGGPPLAPVAAAFAALFVTGPVASTVTAGTMFPSPFGDVAAIRSSVAGERHAAASIALTGGLLASSFSMLSALVTWTLSRPAVTGDPALVRALHDLAFLTGGPATVVAFGLLFAGIAVPALLVGLRPRWLAVAGLVFATVAELSTLTLAWPAPRGAAAAGQLRRDGLVDRYRSTAPGHADGRPVTAGQGGAGLT